VACSSTPAPATPDPDAPHLAAADGALVFYYPADQPLAGYAAGDRGAYVVSIEGVDRERALREAGASGGTHLEGARYVYRLTDEERARVAALPFASVDGPLAPEQRYDPARPPNGDALIELFEDASPSVDQAVADLLTSWGTPARVVAPNTLRATIAAASLPAIARISPIRWIEPR
jgi:hypothetical protein